MPALLVELTTNGTLKTVILALVVLVLVLVALRLLARLL
jgi:hypothetical protein